jgi:iron complex outermembrane receptor protein
MRIKYAAVSGDGGLPLVFGIVGNGAFQTERLTAAEAGYRVQFAWKASVDVAVYWGSYDHLAIQEPVAPQLALSASPYLLVPTLYQNFLAATTAGVEMAAHVQPAAWYRLDGSYSTFHVTSHPDLASQNPTAGVFDANAPAHQWQLHASVWPSPYVQVDASVYRVGSLRVVETDAYTRADGRVESTVKVPLRGCHRSEPVQSRHADTRRAIFPSCTPVSPAPEV